MPRTVIAVADTVFPSLDLALGELKPLDPELRISKSSAAEDILAVAEEADAILVTYAKLPGELIRALKRCRAIGRFGLGVDNIDIAAATEKGIPVTYVPDYCMQEVSDHAMAFLLALGRKIVFSNKLVQAGRWEMPAVVPMRRLSSLTLGLLGFGNIARALVPKAKAFGMRVIAHDPFAKADAFKALGVEYLSFDALLASSDFVSLHVPLLPATRGLIEGSALAKMKRTASLINTSRGPLIDETALVAALDAGTIAGAALDVVASEPLAKNSPLLGRDNVILSPHTGFYSVEALAELQTKCASDVRRVLMGERPIYPVNPEVLKK
jgi:D-3-phosphoglycerate dehydrogenase